MVPEGFIKQRFTACFSSDADCNAGPEEGEAKEGEQQANSSLEESHAEDPIELLNRMSGKSDRLRDCAKPNLSPITPTFEHDGYSTLHQYSTLLCVCAKIYLLVTIPSQTCFD